MSWPAISIVPPLGVVKPAIIRSVVVLPEPDGPSSVTNSPRRTSRSTPSTAVTLAERLAEVRAARAPAARPTAGRRPAAGDCRRHGRRLAADDEQQQQQRGRDDHQRGRDGRDGRIDHLADLLPHLDRQRPESGVGHEDRDDDLVPGRDEREQRPGEDARQDDRERHPPERPARVGAQAGRGQLEVAVHRPQIAPTLMITNGTASAVWASTSPGSEPVERQ